jgi:hypothetical protein
MHPWRTVLLIHIFFSLFISSAAQSETLKSPEEERLLLQSELTLAQKTHVYFTMHLKEKKIYFKARGIILRELEIKKMRFWGHSEKVKLSTLASKAAASEPRREAVVIENAEKDEKAPVITPPAGSPTTPASIDIKALELEDMPSSFSLILDDGLVISVKPDNQGTLSGLYSIARSLNWYISQPILTVWYAIKSRPYGALNLVLNEKDAKALYWSIYEGNGVLIYNPQNH